MSSRQQLFFIALLPPPEVQKKATEIKQHFAEVYNSRAALKSPPHITLQPPFKWSLDDYPQLIKVLQGIARNQSPIPMVLDGFAAFKPRVIFIKVLKTQELYVIHKETLDNLESSLGIIDPLSKKRPFKPHLTVAFRDLTKPNFYQAWDEFADKPFYFQFIVPRLTLLRHNGKGWDIDQEFVL